MHDRMIAYCLEEPRRLIGTGQLLSFAGAFLLLLAAIANVMTKASGIALAYGQKAANTPTLSTLLPDLPTWWVPESLGGCFLSAVMIVVGAWLVIAGRRYQRMLEAL